MEQVISHIQTFRDYFHYHIKASKAYIHSRMRKRTADFLQGEHQLFKSHKVGGGRILTLTSSTTCETRERGTRAKDGDRKVLQGAGLDSDGIQAHLWWYFEELIGVSPLIDVDDARVHGVFMQEITVYSHSLCAL